MLYLIPGLGADERVFQFLQTDDLDHQVIQWESPLPDESLEAYVARLEAQIDPAQTIDLLGVSFGGMIALELAQRLTCRRVFLISSFLSPKELPLRIRWLGKYFLQSWIPDSWLRFGIRSFSAFLFGPMHKKDAKLHREVMADINLSFLRWAGKKILSWQEVSIPNPLIRLHGTRDRILPIRKVPTCIMIQGGGHWMIVSHAKEISDWIRGDWVK